MLNALTRFANGVSWCASQLASVAAAVLTVAMVYEVFARYAGRPAPSAPRPFRDHVAWLQAQDVASAEAFWREPLAGVEAPTPLGLERPTGRAGRLSAQAVLDAGAVRALQGLCRARQWTLNTLVQGAWAVLLSRLAGEASVLFGAVSSGRPVAGWDHGGVGEQLARWWPAGAVPVFDAGALAANVAAQLARGEAPAVTMPDTLRAMQEATLSLYAELAGQH